MSPVLVADNGSDVVELGPALSIFDPVYFGIDEFGQPKRVPLIERNILIGGEPGSGKSGLLNGIVAHAALSLDCRLMLLDGKRVELGQWRKCADVFVGPNIEQALKLLKRLQILMDRRYDYLEECERRKIIPGDVFTAILLAIDEIAYFSATVGTKQQKEEFNLLLRDLVARGRAIGLIVAAATQRPSSKIIDTDLRDLFAWRFAGRCTNDSSSDIVLGHGWVAKGWSANAISPNNPGAGLLIAENGSPELLKVAYLDDRTCAAIAAYAATLRATAATEKAVSRVLRSVPPAA
ncbi:FtsK/SpoIIIE domain-containing protein [Paractinoplanes globisporus]|uniref:FtsK/SpoIIIE domain-containing protein n=1 Tax=Paractinoplanes globisporus TaxID=113565 RepID=A0ABW6WH55_9ACTN|nr:FtsK/SpoIIIE domain-containing protein [Actinoplanes globisporus]